jgi:hypothetical protein
MTVETLKWSDLPPMDIVSLFCTIAFLLTLNHEGNPETEIISDHLGIVLAVAIPHRIHYRRPPQEVRTEFL